MSVEDEGGCGCHTRPFNHNVEQFVFPLEGAGSEDKLGRKRSLQWSPFPFRLSKFEPSEWDVDSEICFCSQMWSWEPSL